MRNVSEKRSTDKQHVCFMFSEFFLPRAGIEQSVERLAMGWTIQGSNSGGSEIFRTRPERR